MTTMNPTNLSRFVVGIDLGTTNCAVSYFDFDSAHPVLQNFRIPQIGKHGQQEAHLLLPSFIFLEDPDGFTIGINGKAQGAKIPTRLIQSAKSWLSNPAASRREKILPFESIHPDKRISPVEASAFLIDHIRNMWNCVMAKGNGHFELEEQEIILTVPASFDEVARTLTVEAANKAHLKNLTLLEEPQAAFYSWLSDHDNDPFIAGETILICDVGGGTTDFTLINIVEGDSQIEMRRMAVGKHLLLGGDNMDAALCYALESQMHHELDLIQHLNLTAQARSAKETLLNDSGEKNFSIFLAGSGSKVVGDSQKIDLHATDVEEILLNGFFGLYPFEEALQLQKRSGIRQMGLSYESEPSITKHLASFLNKNGLLHAPNYVLFNGGSMKPAIFQKRIVDSLSMWFPKSPPTHVLPINSFDLAVARGAAFFGKLRRENKMCIGGGLPRSYYIGIDIAGEKRAVTLLARGAKEETKAITSQTFFLLPNRHVSFQLYHSNTRLFDQPGEVVPIEESELSPLPAIHTVCQYGKKNQSESLPVKLELYLSAIGTLEMWLLSTQSSHRWKLDFQLRGESQDKRTVDENLDQCTLKAAQQEMQNAFAVGAAEKLHVLMPSLEKILEKDRREWSPSVLRHLFDTLQKQAEKRLLSGFYESRFWNLAGFFLRPGLGYPLDDHRIKQLWKILLIDLKKPKSEEVVLQYWICYRRIAAGLSKGAQAQIFNELMRCKLKKKGYAYAEYTRALAALELVECAAKIKLGSYLMEKIVNGKGEPCDYWALGRLGARQLFHGSVANVIPPKICEEWIEALISTSAAQNSNLPFTLAMLARKTDLKEINLSSLLIEKIKPLLANEQDLLCHVRELSNKEQEHFFGESLPSGLYFNVYS